MEKNSQNTSEFIEGINKVIQKHNLNRSKEDNCFYEFNGPATQEAMSLLTPFKKTHPVISESNANYMNELNNQTELLNSKEYREQKKNEVMSLLYNYGYLTYYNYKYYTKNGRVYVPYIKDEVDMKIFEYGKYYGIILTPYEVNEIHKMLKFQPKMNIEQPDADYATLFSNGYVDNNTGLFVECPTYFPMTCIQANYIPYGNYLHHPKFDAFLLKLSNGNHTLVKRMKEVMGYIISSDNRAKRFFLIIGESGNNGKSTFLELLRKILPKTAVKNMALSTMFGSNFSLSQLAYKRLNISSDEGQTSLRNTEIGLLKSFTGAKDSITVDVKFGDTFDYLPTCKLIIASNYDLTSYYAASGKPIVDRMCLLPFNAVIPKEEQIEGIVDEILAEERDAIATDLHMNYRHVKSRNYMFTGDEEYKVSYILSSGDMYPKIKEFCDNHCAFDSKDNFTTSEKLLEKYESVYGEANTDASGFSQRFKSVCNDSNYDVKNHRSNKKSDYNKRGFKGVRIKEDFDISSNEQFELNILQLDEYDEIVDSIEREEKI